MVTVTKETAALSTHTAKFDGSAACNAYLRRGIQTQPSPYMFACSGCEIQTPRGETSDT